MTTSKKPILVEIFEAAICNDESKWAHIMDQRANEALNVRAICSTEHEGGAQLGLDIDTIQAEAPWMICPFKGPRFGFVSASAAIQAYINKGKSVVLLDWSFSFDSNVAEKVRAFFNHEEIEKADRDRVVTLLRLIRRHSLQTDFVPFIYENLRLQRDNPKNERPLNSIAAFKAIDYVDWKVFETNPTYPTFLPGKSPKDLLDEARRTYEEFLDMSEFDRREIKALFAHAFLLELIKEWLENEDRIEVKFSRLIDHCVFELGQVPLFELYIAWEFLKKPERIRFFGPVAGLGKKVMKNLNGMAWDLAHMRILETMATNSRFGSFFMPFIVSFDDKLVDLIRSNPILCMVIDDQEKSVMSAREHDVDFQSFVREQMSDRVKSAMDPTEVDRRRRMKLDREKLQALVTRAEPIVEKLFAQARVLR